MLKANLHRLSRVLPLVILLAGLALFVALGFSQDFGIETLRHHQAVITATVAAHPVLSAFIFFAAFAMLEACAVPAGVPAMVASGFLFGAVEGAALSVLGATAGAILTFFAARTAFADMLERFAGPRLRQIQHGFRRNAFLFLLSTRLLPFFPFFAVNLAAGSFAISLRAFVVASLVGLVPAAGVYAGLGSGLNEIASGTQIDFGLIYVPRILVPLVGLACLTLLPVAWRGLSARKRS